MGVHLYTNGAWTDSGRIYRNSLNLFNVNIEQGTFSSETALPVPSENRVRTSDYIELTAATYTIAFSGAEKIYLYVFDTNNNYIRDESSSFWNNQPFSVVLTNNRKIKFAISKTDNTPLTPTDVSNIMINRGSTALPYEPYNIVDWYTNNGHSYSSGAWS